MKKSEIYLFVLIAALMFVVGRSYYERDNPLILTGDKAVIVAIAATGNDINSPVSYLFGRAPYYIICDRSKGSYKAIPNKFMDAQHAAGLRSAQMLVKMKVDVVIGNNIGFEPYKTFDQAHIEMYTDVKGTAWEALQDYPDGLTKLTEENVPAHFGITGTKEKVPCATFDTQANLGRIVQGKYYICFNCQYRISEKRANGVIPKRCPKCGGDMQEVVAVTAPPDTLGIKPKVKVL